MRIWVLVQRFPFLIQQPFLGDNHWAWRMLISTAVSVSRSAKPQLSHHLSKPQDLWQDKERGRQNIPPAPPFASSTYNYFTPESLQRSSNYPWCFLWCGGRAEAPCDTNSPVLVMWNKHQLTTHQSLWDSPILFRGEWIILPNPNTLSAPDCHGQSCWATLRIQCKLPPLRWQFQVRQSETGTGGVGIFSHAAAV